MTPETRLHPGISSQIFLPERLDAHHAAAMRKAGFPSVEVYGFASHFDIGNLLRAKAVRHFFESEGVAISGLHCPISDQPSKKRSARLLSISSADDKIRTLAVETAKRGIDAAAELGASVIVIHFGLFSDTDSPDFVSATFSSLMAIEESLRDSGIRAAYENIGSPVSKISRIRGFIEEYGFANSGICLDTGHANLIEDPAQAILDGGGRLFNLHVSDNCSDSDEHALPFDGCIDWDDIRRALDKIEYSGPFVLEPKSTGDPAEIMQQALDAYRRIFSMEE